ncbi:MAG: HPr family phosphocarrier protein [Chloroflexi bacterium]|nr:MAG: HPr family phosphocarrier protein [Chloroflexota bacterium]
MATEVLSASAVVVGAVAKDRIEAIDLVGGMLVAEGCVTPDYVTEMREREGVVSTYLGNGITGLAVAQFPAGVPWGDEPARLVIGLAATSEEHIGILSRLANILGDEELCGRLGSTTDAAEIHRALTTDEEDAPPTNSHLPEADELVTPVTISNPAGLHARPASMIVDRVRAFEAEVQIEANGRRANARSITALLGLGGAVGDGVRVLARGPDAQGATAAVVAVLTGREGG